MVDTLGFILHLKVSPADVQDRDGARLLLPALGSRYGWLKRIWADGGYAGELEREVANLPRHRQIDLEIVKRSDDMRGFVVLPKRWIVERLFAHLMRTRRLARDFERRTTSAEAMIYWSMTLLMTRRLARSRPGRA